MKTPFDLNLGYLKYLNCVGVDKPFSLIETRKIVNFEEKSLFESLSKFNSDLGLTQAPRSVIYGDAFSCGTDVSKVNSILKCISEGLERWAYFASFEDDVKHLRFDLNPTSTGFAAFPGLFKNKVRSVAKLEALERWTIINWWLGKVKSRHYGKVNYREGELSIFDLACDTDKFFVSLLHFQFSLSHEHIVNAYSFAAGITLDHAVTKAKIELNRNISSLKRFFSKNTKSPVEIYSIEEARLIHFAKAEGFLSFSDKMKFSHDVNTDFSSLETAVDCEVVGDWSKYANVWRYLYKNSHCDDSDFKFFFF